MFLTPTPPNCGSDIGLDMCHSVLRLQNLFQGVVGSFESLGLLLFPHHVLHGLLILIGQLSDLIILLDVLLLDIEQLFHPRQLELLEFVLVFFHPLIQVHLLLLE